MKQPSLLHIIILVLAGFFLPAYPQATGYPDLDLYHSQVTNNYSEALTARKHHLMHTTPIDHFIAEYMERGAAVLRDTVSLFSFFNHGTVIVTGEERQQIIDEVYAAARKHKSKRLKLAADYFKAFLGNPSMRVVTRVENNEKVVRTTRKLGEVHIELRALYDMHGITAGHAAQSLAYAQRLEEALDKVTEEQYPEKHLIYSRLGMSYYNFKDHDRALPLLHKGLHYPGEKVRTWNYLGVYHQMQGNLDSAAYYHRMILTDEDGRRQPPVHLAIAISNLGKLELAQGNNDAAIAMLQAGLNVMKKEPKYELSFVVGLYTSLGEAWLAKGDLDRTANYIDSVYQQRYEIPDMAWQQRAVNLFALQSRYYGRLKQYNLSKLYQDSSAIANRNYIQLSGQHHIVLGKQRLQAAEIELQAQQMAHQRNLIALGTTLLVLVSIALIIILHLYRRKDAAHKMLAQKARQWAMPAEASTANSTLRQPMANGSPEEEYRQIMTEANNEMEYNRAYRQTSITIDSFAQQLNIPRNTLSKAINKVTGNNFSYYVNDYRVKEAVRLMVKNTDNDLSINELYEQVGFGNRASFYRVFKQFTGLSPVEFQKQKTETAQDTDI